MLITVIDCSTLMTFTDFFLIRFHRLHFYFESVVQNIIGKSPCFTPERLKVI